MHSHSFQDIEFNFHRNVNDSQWQVLDGLSIPPYPGWVRYKGLITQKTLIRCAFAQFSRYRVKTSQERQWLSVIGRGGVDNSTVPSNGSEIKCQSLKNVNSTCIRTVFKLRSSNFTGTSMILRHRSWRGWRFHRTPRWDINKGLITQKNVNSMCIRTVFKIQSSNFTGTSMTLRERSWRGWQFHRTPIWVRNKVSITQKTLIRRAFAQFSSYEVQTSQERQWLSETGRAGVDDSILPPDGSEKKG